VVRIGIDNIQPVTATSITQTTQPSSKISIAVQQNDSRHNEGQSFPPDTCIIQFNLETKNCNSHVVHFRVIFSLLLLFLCTTDQLRLNPTRLEKNIRSSGPIGTVNCRVSGSVVGKGNNKQWQNHHRPSDRVASFHPKKQSNLPSRRSTRDTIHLI